MDEPTHKMVNGKRVDLTEEEVQQTKAEWAEGEKQAEKRSEQQKQRELKRKLLLDRLGITDEEARLLQG